MKLKIKSCGVEIISIKKDSANKQCTFKWNFAENSFDKAFITSLIVSYLCGKSTMDFGNLFPQISHSLYQSWPDFIYPKRGNSIKAYDTGFKACTHKAYMLVSERAIYVKSKDTFVIVLGSFFLPTFWHNRPSTINNKSYIYQWYRYMKLFICYDICHMSSKKLPLWDIALITNSFIYLFEVPVTCVHLIL